MDPHTNNDERSSMYQVEEEEEDNNSTSETSTSPTEDCEDVETVKTATAASSGIYLILSMTSSLFSSNHNTTLSVNIVTQNSNEYF